MDVLWGYCLKHAVTIINQKGLYLCNKPITDNVSGVKHIIVYDISSCS